jgi:hypothetical protein
MATHAPAARPGELVFNPIVWFDRDQVTCILDDSTRRNRCRFSPVLTPQIEWLRNQEKARTCLRQYDFILLLRTMFAGCLDGYPTLVESCRKINFSVGSEGGSEVRQGKASVGKSIISQIQGLNPIPEDIDVTVQVFQNVVVPPMSVPCALELNAENQTFQLIPYSGSVEEAIAAAEGEIGIKLESMLGDAKVPVLYGEP